MIRSNCHQGPPGRGRVPRWSPPPPPPGNPGAHHQTESSFDSTLDRDDMSSLDDASACGRSIPIPRYWMKDKGHSSHGSQPSDGFASPVYQSPFPEEQRLYYEPQPQIIPHPNQQAYHQVSNPPNLQCNGQHPVNNTLSRANVRQSQNSPGSHQVAPSPTSTPAGLHACGGHCIAFESFCHYCLQVCFVAGILTGISLCIAGAVLRTPSGSHSHPSLHRGPPKRGGDLVVLVYIGALSAMVCSVLLAVQCCVAGQLENRKRGIGVNSGNRHMRVVGSNGGFLLPNPGTQPQQIQMSTLHRSNPSSVVTHDTTDRLSHDQEPINRQPQLQPLLARLVQRDHQEWDRGASGGAMIAKDTRDRRLKDVGDWEHNSLPRSGVVATTNVHGVTSCHRSCDHYRLAQDHNGVPWWRKDGPGDTRH